MTRYAVLLTIALGLPIFSASLLPIAHAAGTQYYLNPVPVFTQEGYTIVLVLTVIGATPLTTYQFVFQTKDPSGKTWTSNVVTENTTATETSFSKLITYPSPNFLGTNSLCCRYDAQVNQIRPISMLNVASNTFYIILTDKTEYQRTENVGIRATGYNASESVSVTIRTQTTSTLVFSQTLTATSAGVVSTSWKVPRNATIDNYVVTLTGTSTKKNPPDAQGFGVNAASMTISALTSSKSIYQRTETMTFSFQASYPDGSFATTGIALETLARPNGGNVTLTASYASGSQTFNATYKTSLNNQTGTWTASLSSNGYGDAYGNTGPKTSVTTSPQLTAASLTVNIVVISYFALGQQVKFNATISYPDGSQLRSGSVGSYLLFSGSPSINDTVPIVFDTTLNLWVGTYSRQPGDPGGLWSLGVKGDDSSAPPNTGSSTRAITLQDNLPVASFTASPTTAQTAISIIFNGTGSYDPDGTIVSYSWNFGDGIIGSGATPSHSYNTAGTYTVTLTVTDNSGSTASSSSQFTITAPTSSSSGNVSFPLYYFGILAALIGAILAGGFLAFRRHKVTHAKLKIDLEAVKSEAGRIENQEFFQSVKDQLRKDKDA
jgi:PKD repeat protein